MQIIYLLKENHLSICKSCIRSKVNHLSRGKSYIYYFQFHHQYLHQIYLITNHLLLSVSSSICSSIYWWYIYIYISILMDPLYPYSHLIHDGQPSAKPTRFRACSAPLACPRASPGRGRRSSWAWCGDPCLAMGKARERPWKVEKMQQKWALMWFDVILDVDL